MFALLLNNARGISNSNVGFRAALLSQPDGQGLRAVAQCGENKGIYFLGVLLYIKKQPIMETASNLQVRAVTHDLL